MFRVLWAVGLHLNVRFKLIYTFGLRLEIISAPQVAFLTCPSPTPPTLFSPSHTFASFICLHQQPLNPTSTRYSPGGISPPSDRKEDTALPELLWWEFKLRTDILKMPKYECCPSAPCWQETIERLQYFELHVPHLVPIFSTLNLHVTGRTQGTLVCKVTSWIYLFASSSWPFSLASGLLRENNEKSNTQGIC